MSPFGTKRTFLIASAMSAFGGKADISQPSLSRVEPSELGDVSPCGVIDRTVDQMMPMLREIGRDYRSAAISPSVDS
jgi:hypothetical protein